MHQKNVIISKLKALEVNKNNFKKQVALWEKEKKDRISQLDGFLNTTDFTDKKDIIKTEEYIEVNVTYEVVENIGMQEKIN